MIRKYQNTVDANLSVGGGPSQLKLPLLANDGHVPTSLPLFVPFVLGDTHDGEFT